MAEDTVKPDPTATAAAPEDLKKRGSSTYEAGPTALEPLWHEAVTGQESTLKLPKQGILYV